MLTGGGGGGWVELGSRVVSEMDMQSFASVVLNSWCCA